MMRKGRQSSLITSGGKGGREEVHRTIDFQKDKNNGNLMCSSVGVELKT